MIWKASAALAAVLCLASPADAEIINVDPHNAAQSPIPVSLPHEGWEICSFSIVYFDTVPKGWVVGKLFRRPIQIGESIENYYKLEEMASIRSVGADAGIRRKTTRKIKSRRISPAENFYYVNRFYYQDDPYNIMDIIGYQIHIEPHCNPDSRG